MGDDPNQYGNSRRWIITEVENSLRRLGTDWIDLYQIHRPEPDTDIDETLGALTDLVRQGKVRYIGSSTFPAESIVEAQWTAERRGRERFVCEQPPYSILVRGIEADVLPTCERYGMAVIPWSPLAGGWLTGRYRKDAEVPESRRSVLVPQRYDMSLPGNQRKLEAADALAELADEAGPHADPDGPRLRPRASGGHRRRSSARAPWSTWRASSPPPTCELPPTSSTGSTRSSRPRRTSTRPTPATARRRSTTPGCGGGVPAGSRPGRPAR